MSMRTTAAAFLIHRHAIRPVEYLPWALALASYLVFPGQQFLATQILIMALFALSLDLVLGYAGIITLGHAAFFGTGAYAAGLLAVHGGLTEPLVGLLVAGVAAGIVGYLSGRLLLRTEGLTLLMLTVATTIVLQKIAVERSDITGGSDGLRGIAMGPVLGLFAFDLQGHTAYWYVLAVVLALFALIRALVHSPFGRSLAGIRENVDRMHAIGAPVSERKLAAYTLSAAIAGIAGALLTQTTEFVADEVLSFERSGEVLIILILGGTGRLYGAFVGAFAYMVMQDKLAKAYPEYWQLGIGLMMIAVVLFARNGILGIADRVLEWWRGKTA
jgi:branched-chain amino acid transport system permease protein